MDGVLGPLLTNLALGAQVDGLPHGEGKESSEQTSDYYEGAWVAGKRQGFGNWRRVAPGYDNVSEVVTVSPTTLCPG